MAANELALFPGIVDTGASGLVRDQSAYSGLVQIGVGYTPHSPEFIAWKQKLSVPPPAEMWQALDTMFLALTSNAGLWSKLLALYLPTFEYNPAATKLINAKTPGTFDGTITGGVTLVPGAYILGDGTTGFVDTGINPSTLALQNTFGLEFWSITASQGSAVDIGNTNSIMTTRTATDNFSGRLNAASAHSTANTDGIGLFGMSRTSTTAASERQFINGVLKVSSGGAVSAAPDNNSIYYLGRNGTASFSSRKSLLGAVHTGFSDAEEAAFAAAVGALFDVTITQFGQDQIYQQVGGSATITFSGTHNPGSENIEAQVVNAATGQVVVPWAVIAAAPSGSTWSGTIVVPKGGFYYLYVRKAGSGKAFRSSSTFGVGELILMWGQSNIRNMWSMQASPPGPNQATRRWSKSTTGQWFIPDLPAQASEPNTAYGANGFGGNGAVVFCNALSNSFGCPVGMLQLAIGGTTIDTWVSGGSSFVTMNTAIVAALGGPQYTFGTAIWLQGETDATGGTAPASYTSNLTLAFSNLRTLASNAALPIYICVLGTMTGGTDAGIDAIRQAIIAFTDANASGAEFYGSSAVDLVRTDQYHFSPPYYERMGRRFAQLILVTRGLKTVSAIGPKVTTATSSIGSNTIVVNVQQAGGTLLWDASNNPAGTGLTGFDVEVDTVVRTVTAAVITTATKITLTFSGAPTVAAAKVRYQYGGLPVITNPVYDNAPPQGDARGCPLQPTRGQVTVAVS